MHGLPWQWRWGSCSGRQGVKACSSPMCIIDVLFSPALWKEKQPALNWCLIRLAGAALFFVTVLADILTRRSCWVCQACMSSESHKTRSSSISFIGCTSNWLANKMSMRLTLLLDTWTTLSFHSFYIILFGTHSLHVFWERRQVRVSAHFLIG